MLSCKFERSKRTVTLDWRSVLGEDKLPLYACLGTLLVEWFNFTLTVLAIFLFAGVQQHFFTGIFDFVTSQSMRLQNRK